MKSKKEELYIWDHFSFMYMLIPEEISGRIRNLAGFSTDHPAKGTKIGVHCLPKTGVVINTSDIGLEPQRNIPYK